LYGASRESANSNKPLIAIENGLLNWLHFRLRCMQALDRAGKPVAKQALHPFISTYFD
jgi:hypothetical protein